LYSIKTIGQFLASEYYKMWFHISLTMLCMALWY